MFHTKIPMKIHVPALVFGYMGIAATLFGAVYSMVQYYILTR